MFKYDSTHGIFDGTIKVVDDATLEINGKQITVVSKRYCIFLFNCRNSYILRDTSCEKCGLVQSSILFSFFFCYLVFPGLCISFPFFFHYLILPGKLPTQLWENHNAENRKRYLGVIMGQNMLLNLLGFSLQLRRPRHT